MLEFEKERQEDRANKAQRHNVHSEQRTKRIASNF